MELAADLTAPALRDALGDRPFRTYPALLSTQAEALAWARAGAPPGAVVVADYQASPRGRGGIEWTVRPGSDLGFSLVLRPALPAAREGWLYVAVAAAIGDVVDADELEWPDTVRRAGELAGSVGIHAELGPAGVAWAAATALVAASPPRGRLLARLAEGVEARLAQPASAVLRDYLPRCATIGRTVTARMVPLGPAGAVVTGRAATVLADGALVIETAAGRRVAVRPQSLGRLEAARPRPGRA